MTLGDSMTEDELLAVADKASSDWHKANPYPEGDRLNRPADRAMVRAIFDAAQAVCVAKLRKMQDALSPNGLTSPSICRDDSLYDSDFSFAQRHALAVAVETLEKD